MTKNNYKITMAEFKGRVLAHLEDIQRDLADVKAELKTKACKEDVRELREQIRSIKLGAAIVGGIGGALSSAAAFLGLNRRL